MLKYTSLLLTEVFHRSKDIFDIVKKCYHSYIESGYVGIWFSSIVEHIFIDFIDINFYDAHIWNSISSSWIWNTNFMSIKISECRAFLLRGVIIILSNSVLFLQANVEFRLTSNDRPHCATKIALERWFEY